MLSNFFSEICTVYEIIPKNVVTEGPQMTSQYGAYSLHAWLERLHARMDKHTHTRQASHVHVRRHAQKNK